MKKDRKTEFFFVLIPFKNASLKIFTGRKAVLIAVILGAYHHLKLEIVRKIFSADFIETIDLHKYRHCKLFTLSMYQFLTIRNFYLYSVFLDFNEDPELSFHTTM